jgi:hypothetical protein
MIDIGSIAHGPELERRPVLQDANRLAQALRTSEPAAIELVFVIPGTVGGPDFSGFELRWRRSPRRVPIIFVEVSRDLAASDEPMSQLIDLAQAGLEFARTEVDPARTPDRNLDVDALLESLEQSAVALLGAHALARHSAGSARPVSAMPRRPDDDRVAAEIHLPLGNRADAVDEAFMVEDALERLLEGRDIGYVDGNEVGTTDVVIYAFGTLLEPLRAAAVDAVRANWSRGGASILMLAGGEEMDRISVD